jgi:DeoR/GlpR family transcriptional regulator of sugar metabolism
MGGFDHNGSKRHVVPAQRREWIVARLRTAGSVTVQELETEFGVSPMTARRDLQVLARQGRATRTHGGALAPGLARQEDSFEARLERDAPSKERLGGAACGLVADGEAVFVDSSTTAYFAVRSLLDAARRITVLTNSLAVMDLVARSEHPHPDLIGLAGSLRKPTRSFVGPATVEAIGRHFADKLLFSVNGIAPGGMLTEADPLEAEVKRAMVDRSRTAILMVDGSKFERAGLSAITGIREVERVLVADATPAQVAPFASAGIQMQEVR